MTTPAPERTQPRPAAEAERQGKFGNFAMYAWAAVFILAGVAGVLFGLSGQPKEVAMGSAVVGPAFGVWPQMTIYEQKLWFDSCAADSAILVLSVALVLVGIAVVIRYTNIHWEVSSSYWRARGYVFEYGCWALLLLWCTAYIFDWVPGRTVRLAILGNNIEVVKCAARAAVRHAYPLADIAFDYHFEAPPEHHSLDIRNQQTGEQVARIEMRGSFNFQALRKLAPNVWAAYQCQRGESRVRDECRMVGGRP
jgi:hypothetical protein